MPTKQDKIWWKRKRFFVPLFTVLLSVVGELFTPIKPITNLISNVIEQSDTGGVERSDTIQTREDTPSTNP